MTPDVLVVGAGPAGSTLATLLARRGWWVVVVDRATFPRPKPCGEFISPGALRAMERLELTLPQGGASAAHIDGWTLDIDGVVLSAEFRDGDRGRSLPRSDFDTHLLTHARQAGAEVLEGTRLTRRGTGSMAPVRIRSGSATRTVAPRVLVGAGGLRCPVASHINASELGAGRRKVSLTGRVQHLELPPHRGRLIVRGDLTIGVAASSPDATSWNVTVVVPSHRYGRRIATEGVPAFYRACLARAGLGDELSVVGDRILASGPFDRPRSRMWSGNTVLVGDAAGYYDPFTGQGIYQALRSAEVLGGWLHGALAGSLPLPAAFHGYERVVRRERRATKRLQVWVDRSLSSPWGRRLVKRALARNPTIYEALLQATTDRQGLAAAVAGSVRGRMTGKSKDQMNELSLPSGTV